ncbi:undecaprenyl-diphosphatase, partial [Streptococcus suis]
GYSLYMEQVWIFLFAIVTASLVSLVFFRFWTDFVKKHDFTVFGYYRIVLGEILLVYAFIT